MTRYDTLPGHMQGAMRRYIEQGIAPGSFGLAVLSNDLVMAFGRADHINTLHMQEWASWLYNECPPAAWGSLEKVDAWLRTGGLVGQGYMDEATPPATEETTVVVAFPATGDTPNG